MKDSFGREITYLRLSVTERCNLRCRYCMPEEGICKKSREEMLTEDEMIRAVTAAASIGIKKVRITGGEPLVKKNLLSIISRTASVPGIEEICLTTNAILLAENAEKLREAGVSRVNISLDTLDPKKYGWITRGGHLADAVSGIRAALAAGFDKIKLNAVLMKGINDGEIRNLAALTESDPVDVRFIELMPMPGSGLSEENTYLPVSAVLEAVPELMPEPSLEKGVAALYRIPGAKGCVGLISPISAHFCASCDRLRLTADGKIKPCLHSAAEYPIKGLDEEGMRRQFIAAVGGKIAWHGELTGANPSRSARGMSRIGG